MRRYRIYLKGFKDTTGTMIVTANKITLAQGSIIFDDKDGSTVCIVPGDSIVERILDKE